MTVTFCGHANFREEDGIFEKLLGILEREINGENVEFLLGGYGQFDSFCARCAREYKKIHPNSKLVLILPYLDKLKGEIEYEISYCDETEYPSLERVPRRLAILRRNQWMVMKSDLVISYVDHHWGGAFQTVLFAYKKSKKIINLAHCLVESLI